MSSSSHSHIALSCPVCELCGTLKDLRLCAACKDAWYCSKEHQKKDWKTHKPTCKSKSGSSSSSSTSSTKPQDDQGGGGGGEGKVSLSMTQSEAGDADCSTDERARTHQHNEEPMHHQHHTDPQCVKQGEEEEEEGGGVPAAHSPYTDTIVTAAAQTGAHTTGASGGADGGGGGDLIRSTETGTDTTPVFAPTTEQASSSSRLAVTANLTSDSGDSSAAQTAMTYGRTVKGDGEKLVPVARIAPMQPSQVDKTKSKKRRNRKRSSTTAPPDMDQLALQSVPSSATATPDMDKLALQPTRSSTTATQDMDQLALQSMPTPTATQSATTTQTLPEPNKATQGLADYVVKYLTEYGICVLDKFLGEERGNKIYDEVVALHSEGNFQDGQLITGKSVKQKIRGDQISWVEKGEVNKDQISFLMSRLDSLMMACSERFKKNEIGGRTKAMVACYPGSGSYYLRHVDNPNEDGRLITCIYYLNKDWVSKRDGGVLRIFPESTRNSWIADIDPQFDRLLFFWSDRRNPHEVQAAHKQRFAITVWYFDKAERQQALQRHQNNNSKPSTAKTMSTTLVCARPVSS